MACNLASLIFRPPAAAITFLMQSACMVYDFLMWFPEPLRFVVAISIMASIVPITGLCVFGGSWKHAWAYTKQWLYVVGGMALAGFLIALLFL